MSREARSAPLIERLGMEFFRSAPTTPGVYFMLGEDDRLLYVGKANNLRTRLATYARVAQGRSPGKLVRLTAAVRTIRWEQYRTESEALARETDLLRGVRPPFNEAQTDRGEYLFITVSDVAPGRVRFTMSANGNGTHAYGCFPYTARAPEAFPALLRLLHLAQGRTAPSRITRASGCEMALDDDLRGPVHLFLSGRSPRLVPRIAARLPAVDDFVLRAARRDLVDVMKLYADGPRATRRLRLRHKLGPGPISAERMDELVKADLQVATGSRVRTREAVENRILAMGIAGLGSRAIADALNAEGVPGFGTGGAWTFWAVGRVLGRYGWREAATPSARTPQEPG